jgi:hypothetical protein
MGENNCVADEALRKDLEDKSPIQIRDRIRGLIRVRARDLVPNRKTGDAIHKFKPMPCEGCSKKLVTPTSS